MKTPKKTIKPPPPVHYFNFGYISVTDAAKKLGISRARVHQFISDGRLPVIRAGAQYLVKPKDLDNIEKRRPGRPRKNKK